MIAPVMGSADQGLVDEHLKMEVPKVDPGRLNTTATFIGRSGTADAVQFGMDRANRSSAAGACRARFGGKFWHGKYSPSDVALAST